MAFPSTFADLKAEVIARIRLDSTADAAAVADWINQVYAEVVVETEALQDTTTISLTAGTNTYTLSTSIIRFKEMYVTPANAAQSRPLIPTSVEQILEWSASNGATSSNAGQVTHYALLGITKILFYPTPSADATVTAYYVKLPTALSSAGDVPMLQEPYVSNCLTEGACYQAALFVKDPDAQLYKANYEQAKRDLRAHLRRREGAMTRQFRVTRGDSVIPHDPSTDVRGWR